jgi:hypothetical protein
MNFGIVEISFGIGVAALVVGAYLLGYVHGDNARDRQLWASLKNIKPLAEDEDVKS